MATARPGPSTTLSWLWGDGYTPAPRAISYEDGHNAVQDVLIPPSYPKGINVVVLQSTASPHFAIQHRVGLEPGELTQSPYGPVPGPGARHYSFGAVVTSGSPGAGGGGLWRGTGALDVENGVGKGTLVGDVRGDGVLRVTAQLEDRAGDARGAEWGAALAWAPPSGALVAVARAKHGGEAGASLNARLGPSSPVTVGGEVVLSAPALLARARGAPGAPRGFDAAVGAAYDAGPTRTAVHVASTASFPAVVSLHHLARVTDRATLAAKFMVNALSGSTMAAAGYRLRLRHAASTVTGMIDSYGTVRVGIEREPVRGVKFGLALDARLSPGAMAASAEGPASLSFLASFGAPSRIPVQQSPVTMTRSIFSAT